MSEPEKTSPEAPPTTIVLRPQKTFSLRPGSLAEAKELAAIIATSGMVPKMYDGQPAKVLVAVQMGAELGISPMQAVQNILIINGKPSIYGDMGKALLVREKVVIDEDDIDVIRQTRTGRCRITRPGRAPVQRTFSEQDAKDARLWDERPQCEGWRDGKRVLIDNPAPWHLYPLRQLAWRAFWFAARDCCADLLHGMRGLEEVLDYGPDLDDGGPVGGGTEGGRAAAAAGGIDLGAATREPDPGGYAAAATWANAESPKCPKCGGATRKKSGGKKRDTVDERGQPQEGEHYPPFWSCAKYPGCRGTAKVDHAEARAYFESVGIAQPEPVVEEPPTPAAPASAPAGAQMPLAPAPAPPKTHPDPATLEWVMMKIRIAETQADVDAARKIGEQHIDVPEDLALIRNRADTRWHELIKGKART